jgi:hypothetical protein
VNRTITIERFDLTGKGYNCTANLPRPNQLRPIGAKLLQTELTNGDRLPSDLVLIGDLPWQKSVANGTIKYLDTGMVLTGFNNEPIIYAVYQYTTSPTSTARRTCRAAIYKNNGLTFELRPERWSCFTGGFDFFTGTNNGILVKDLNGVCAETTWGESVQRFTYNFVPCPN